MRMNDIFQRYTFSTEQISFMVKAWNEMRDLTAISLNLPEIHSGMLPFCNAMIMYALLGEYLNECEDLDLYSRDEQKQCKKIMWQFKKAWPGKKPIPMLKD